MYHMTEEGPKPCGATVRDCPLGGTHYQTSTEAEKAFGERFQFSLTGTRKAVSDTLDIQRTEASLTAIVEEEKLHRRLVLSDVDGTLIRGSLANDHAVWMHERGIVDLGDLPARWKADPKNEELVTALAVANIKAIAGKSLKELRVKEFMDEVMSDDGHFYSSLKKLIEARAQGNDVILISGSPQYLIGDFAKRFGFQGVGSTYHRSRDQKFNGRITGMFGAKAKTRVVEKLQVERYDLVEAYGDTISDKPLLEVAHHSVLVDPTEETLAGYAHVSEILRS